MRITQFAKRILRSLLLSRTGTSPSGPAARNKSAHGRGSLCISKTLREGDENNIPADCPSSTDLRTVGGWLLTQYPLAGLVDLVHAKDYQAAHELVGAHDAIQAVFQLADDLDAAQRDDDSKAAEASYA
ncbi:Uncharacterised protein [Burkholderia pseudomallei]|nr:Uncharacterised protein [Burkholderia pseudomallei]